MLSQVYEMDFLQTLWEEWITAKSRYMHERNGKLIHHASEMVRFLFYFILLCQGWTYSGILKIIDKKSALELSTCVAKLKRIICRSQWNFTGPLHIEIKWNGIFKDIFVRIY